MNEIRLFKVLQGHVGIMNEIAVSVLQEKMTADEAQAKAIQSAEALLREITPDGIK